MAAATADLSDPKRARAHARSQAGTTVRAMTTVPASKAKYLPPGVVPPDGVWDETNTCGQHDAFCGASNVKSNARKYDSGDDYSAHPNARDRFLLALAKYGLGKKDIPANVNFFKGVKVEEDGSLTFNERSGKPGQHVE